MENDDTKKLKKEDETNNEDFQFVLEKLLAVYRPILEEELKLSKTPKRLKDEAGEEPTCDDELALANRIFEKFFTEEVAVRLLPEAGRQLLGPVERWRWCFLHIRCCMIFGWLVCRGPRTFRALVYYLYRYWLCVRRALGIAPDNRPLNDEERRDFAVWVKAFSSAYKPYLTNQLATVEFPEGLPEAVVDGEIDCGEGEEAFSAVFERAMTLEAASALMGKAAFEKHRQEPFFWFCRCWCLCAIHFGCCLAKARSFKEIVHCLVHYWRCIRDCFKPLHCGLTNPSECAEEQPNLQGLPPESVGLEIRGSAAGGSFGHYTLEWRLDNGRGACEGDKGWSSEGIHYPGGGATGTVGVNNGLLGVLDTTFLSTGSFEIRICVYAVSSNAAPTCCCIRFVLFKKLVWISRVADTPGAPVQIPPGPFQGNTPIVSGNPVPPGIVVPVGGAIHVKGAAFVGECGDRKIKCYDLRAAVGWHPGPGEFGFAAALPLYTIPMLNAPICYDDVDEIKKRAEFNRQDGLESMLTVFWKKLPWGSEPWVLKPQPFPSHANLPTNVHTSGPSCPDVHHRCRSGQYTLLLEVKDTNGNVYYDTQQLWFDNKPMTNNKHVVFAEIEGLPGCTDLHLESENSPFVPAGAPCGVPWPVNLKGIAYDEYIDETDFSYPSDNFDFYHLTITRQGGPAWQVPITIGADPANPTHGLLRRGQPGERCEALPVGGLGCPPAQIVPGKSTDTLTVLDMRAFDEICVSSIPAADRPPAGFALKRGTCCGYTFQLYAQDKTWSNGWSGGFHHAWSLPWAVCICNDLPKKNGDDEVG